MCSRHLLGKVAESAALLKTVRRCGDSIVLNVLKYSLEKPYGPGDLPFGSIFMTSSISWVVIRVFRFSS